MTLSVATAFIGGVLTIAAPCAAMLIPAFFAYAFTSRTQLLARTGLFLMGLLLALVPLGAFAGGLGALIVAYRTQVAAVAGIAIIALGVVQTLALPFPHIRVPFAGSGANPLAVFLLGVGYGLAGAGCTGPILGTILLLSAQTGSFASGALFMAAYAVGMGTPVVVLALAWKALRLGERRALKPRPIRVLGRDTTVGSLLSGGVCILLGIVLVATGGLTPGGLLDASSQQRLETRVASALATVPTAVSVLLGLAVVAFVALVVVWLRGRHDS
ncbi:MAG: cytochrome c biogenesis protein CcdA [Actinomycetaceae bacterium]|nr:cytochrome c biogenesis protein CcdA [Actinomycetaceae bacterium]